MIRNKLFTAMYMLIATAWVTIGMQSCKKTTYEYAKQSDKEIERFTVAGYEGVDSLSAVIRGDNIVLYWDEKAERPETIIPTIVVSAGAAISPESGQAVGFSDTTSFAVTAEDGSVRIYRLKPVFNQAIPVISRISQVNYPWLYEYPLTLTGQYFLAGGDASAIHVYAQRVSDGFEFDLQVDAGSVTQTNISTFLPEYNSTLDTGLHKIWVKIGEGTSDAFDVWFAPPSLGSDDGNTAEFVEEGERIYPGDSLTINYTISANYDGVFEKFYKGKVETISISLANTAGQFQYLGPENLVVTDNQVRFKLPEEAGQYLDYYVYSIALNFPYHYGPDQIISDILYVYPDDRSTIISTKDE